jgi:hypothetical protein
VGVGGVGLLWYRIIPYWGEALLFQEFNFRLYLFLFPSLAAMHKFSVFPDNRIIVQGWTLLPGAPRTNGYCFNFDDCNLSTDQFFCVMMG